MIATIQYKENIWDIVNVTLDEDDNMMLIGVINVEVIADDVQNNLIGGQVLGFDHDQQLIRISATGAEIRTYISSKTDLFVNGSLVFEKAL